MPSSSAGHISAGDAGNKIEPPLAATSVSHDKDHAGVCPQRCRSANDTSRQFAPCSPARSLSRSPTSRRSTVQERLSSVRTCIRTNHSRGKPDAQCESVQFLFDPLAEGKPAARSADICHLLQ